MRGGNTSLFSRCVAQCPTYPHPSRDGPTGRKVGKSQSEASLLVGLLLLAKARAKQIHLPDEAGGPFSLRANGPSSGRASREDAQDKQTRRVARAFQRTPASLVFSQAMQYSCLRSSFRDEPSACASVRILLSAREARGRCLPEKKAGVRWIPFGT